MSAFGGHAQEISFQLSSSAVAVRGRLYLGSHESAMQLGGIQLVVNCTNDEEVPCFHEGVRYLRIAVNDNESAMILPYLDGAADAIATAVGKGENVLVHCQQGISRSATILAAFLIKHCGLSADAAIEQIQRHRHVANPNLGFRRQLQDFQGAGSSGTRLHSKNTSIVGKSLLFGKKQKGFHGVFHRRFPAFCAPPCEIPGSGTATSLDQTWCYQSLGCFATGRAEAFASLGDFDPRRVVQVALDFVLGRGLLAKSSQESHVRCS